MRPRTTLWAASALLLLASASCATLIGLDDYHKHAVDGGDAAGAGGSGASWATSNSAATGSGGALSASGGTGGGAACKPMGHPGTCEYLPKMECGCTAPGQKCSINTEADGASGCAQSGSLPAWSRCNADKDCAAGRWCDHLTSVCKPICNGVGDCPKNAQCVQAKAKDGVTDIPGLTICTAHCDPESATPCGMNVNCVYSSPITEFDCFASKNVAQGVDCTIADDCAVGLTCVNFGTGSTCEPWCHPTNTTNVKCKGASTNCYPLQKMAIYNGVEYGACMP